VLFDRPFRKKSFSSVSFSRFWFFPANAEKVHNLGFIDRYSWTVWKIAIICDDNCDVIRKTKNYVLNSEKKKEKKRKKRRTKNNQNNQNSQNSQNSQQQKWIRSGKYFKSGKVSALI